MDRYKDVFNKTLKKFNVTFRKEEADPLLTRGRIGRSPYIERLWLILSRRRTTPR